MELRPGVLLDGGRLRLDVPLGRGGFGSVWQAVELFGYGVQREAVVLRRVAVKCLPPLQKEAESARIVEEARALAELVNDSILRFYYAFADATGTYLVTEVATEGDLRSFYDSSIPTETELRDIVLSVSGGLAYLHERGFVHGDLKPENILVTEDNGDSVRYLLADFGLRALIGERRFQGTVPYIAPEAYREAPEPLTEKADVYALGILILETATGRSVRSLLSEGTLDALSQSRANAHALEKVGVVVIDALESADWASLRLPSFVETIVRQCVAVDPSQRPAAVDIPNLWNALERGRSGTLRPYRFPRASGAESRYQMPYVRALRVEETWDADRREPVAVASVVGASDSVALVRVGQKTNLALYTTLVSLRDSLTTRAPMLSLFGVMARDLVGMEFDADFRSYAVVQPFELVDVTTLSGSHHCARYYLHRAVFDPGMLNEAMFRGTILHRLFADHCADPSVSFDELWQRRWAESCLDFAYFLADDDAFRAFRDSVSTAFGRVRRALVHDGALDGAQMELEASRWSYELGLAGRVDALFRSSDGRLRAYELKSGRLRRGDTVQVQAYAAMLREELLTDTATDSDELVEARLLSAGTGRLVEPDTTASYGFLAAVRNEILRLRDCLLVPRSPAAPMPVEYPYFGYQPAKCRKCSELESYLYEECRESTALFGERRDSIPTALPSLERDYFWRWTRVILAEQTEVHRSRLAPLLEVAATAIETEAVGTRAMQENRIEDARLVSRDGDALRFEFSPTLVEFSVGSDALVHRGDARRMSDVLRGTVVESSETSLVLASHLRSRAERFAREVGAVWCVDNVPDARGMNALQRALNIFIRSRNAPMKALVLEGRVPRRQGRLFAGGVAEPTQLAVGHRLNDQQTRALLAAVDESGFLSITGPPGTGKTATIHAIIEAFARANRRVLVAGFTNNAIDNVIERLVGASTGTAVPFFRFGTRRASFDRLAPALEAVGVDPRACFAHTVSEVFPHVAPLREHLEAVSVFAGTAHSLLRSPWIAENAETPAFDVVIVDEATQLQEPFTAALLTLGRKAILVGDEKQLGPIAALKSDPASDDLPESLRSMGVAGLDQSLFARLNRLLRQRGEDDCSVFLSRQYRMHPVIGGWVSERFYDGRLDTTLDAAPESRLLDRAHRQPGWDKLRRICSSEHPFVFLDVDGGESAGPNASRDEARLAAILVRAFNALGVDSVGCITPYRNQLTLLQRALAATGVACECGTVDAFQGREKSVVILSTARRDRLTEFLTNPSRLNVSVTRARAKCVLLGSGSLLRGDPLLWSIVEQESCLRERARVDELERELVSG